MLLSLSLFKFLNRCAEILNHLKNNYIYLILPLPTLQTFLTSLHSKATSTNISIYQDSASDGSTHGTPSFLPLWLLLCTSQLTLLHYMFPQRKDICHRVLFTHSFIRHILLGTYNVPGTQSGTKDTW